jgi:hypothetical protein
VLLLLLGVSHLRNVAVHMNHDKWEIVDLCHCVTDVTVAELTKKYMRRRECRRIGMSQLSHSCHTAVGQQHVPGWWTGGGTRQLPCPNRNGTYHVEGTLHVANKPAVRDLVSKQHRCSRPSGQWKRKCSWYWTRHCCAALEHLINYSATSYLPYLGVGVYALREFIRDSLHVR